MAMKDVVEQYKRRNGEAVYTQKEMMMYLVQRVDGIYTILSENNGRIRSNEQSIQFMQRIGLSVVALFVTSLGWLITRVLK